MEKGPNIKESRLDQVEYREKELARTAMSGATKAELKENKNDTQDKIKEYRKNKEAFIKSKEKYDILREDIVAEMDKSSNESLKNKYQEELKRLRAIEDYSEIQYISNQGELLIGEKLDLIRDWTNKCDEFKKSIIEEGQLPYLVGIDMGIVIDAIAKMEEGSSSEEIKEFISKESDGAPHRELTIARYVTHFGPNGHAFAEKMGIADLSQDIDDFETIKVDNAGETRGI